MISLLMAARGTPVEVMPSVRSALRALSAVPGSNFLIFVDENNLDLKQALENSGSVRVVFSKSKVSLAAALNHLGSKAETPLLARQDSDDFSFPWRFKLQLKHLVREGLDLSFTPALIRREVAGLPLLFWPPKGPLSPAAVNFLLKSTNPLVHSSLLMKKSVFISCGGYRDIRSEDYDLWIRAALSGYRLGRSSLPGVIYTMHQKQMTWGVKQVDKNVTQAFAGRLDELNEGYNLESIEKIQVFNEEIWGRLFGQRAP